MEKASEPQKKCQYCKKEIPVLATRCSFCQGDLRSWASRHKILTAIIIFFVIMIWLNVLGSVTDQNTSNAQGHNNPPSPSQADIVSNPTQVPKESVTTVSSPQIASSTPNDNGGPVLTRKTVIGVVRMSTIGLNKAMNINQQTIIFGGDKGALENGTGSFCIINGDKNFVNAVIGDTLTATGDAVTGTNTLINCRVVSLK